MTTTEKTLWIYRGRYLWVPVGIMWLAGIAQSLHLIPLVVQYSVIGIVAAWLVFLMFAMPTYGVWQDFIKPWLRCRKTKEV